MEVLLHLHHVDVEGVHSTNQGRTEKLKGGGRILRKIYYFREILNKMSQKVDCRPPPSMIVMHFYYTTELSYWQARLIFHTVVKPPPHKANPFLDKKINYSSDFL